MGGHAAVRHAVRPAIAEAMRGGRREDQARGDALVSADAIRPLRGYVRDAEIFKDHGGAGLL